MKIDLVVFAVYAAILSVVVPDSALTQVALAALLGAGITWITGAKHFYVSFQWFRTHALQAFGLAGLVTVFVLMPFVLGPLLFHSAPLPITHLPDVLVQAPVTFLWFWVFMAAGTRLRERKINRLVERRLAERQCAGIDQGEPRE